jgi:ABC-type sugar transport system ATPase subunit
MQVESRLSVRNLSVWFGGNRALDSLDLDVPAGRMVALLGANGSGKSTTVKALTGINPIRPGAKIRLGGAALAADAMNPVETQRRGIRVVHQEAPLVPDLTVAEAMAINLGFPTSAGFIRWRRLAEDSRLRRRDRPRSAVPHPDGVGAGARVARDRARRHPAGIGGAHPR